MTARHCVFTLQAEDDLEAIAFAITRDNPGRALSFVAELQEHCRRIALDPLIYRLREEYGDGVRVAVHPPYLVFYTPREGAVVIERIIHGARHIDWVRQ